MTTELFRICPTCGLENAPEADFCSGCNAFITAVRPTPKPAETLGVQVPAPDAPEEIQCSGCGDPVELGLVGDDGMYLCGSCGNMFGVDTGQDAQSAEASGKPVNSPAGSSPSVGSPTQPADGATIIERNPVMTIGQCSYRLKENDVIGRQGTVAVDRFEPFDAVSRQHVLVVREQGVWGLRVPSRVQNQTSLDGRELPRDQFVPLVGTHLLQLSSQCNVQIGLG
jgi:hypothetical protein